jgi:glutamate racemase
VSDHRPIGIFDSGAGGLSVLQAIRFELPHENIVYVADSGNAPYGDRSQNFIEQRSLAIVEFLRAAGVKAVVVACNTATSVAVKTIRARYAFPVVAMEPAVKPAVTMTSTGVVGVLATTRTLSSANFLRLVDEHGSRARVLIQACPGLVEQVERGEVAGEETRKLVEGYVKPLVAAQTDTVVLGCTHYAFLRPLIQEVAGPTVTLIDPAVPVARELKRRLETANLLATSGTGGDVTFWTSGEVEPASTVFGRLLGRSVTVRALPVGGTES